MLIVLFEELCVSADDVGEVLRAFPRELLPDVPCEGESSGENRHEFGCMPRGSSNHVMSRTRVLRRTNARVSVWPSSLTTSCSSRGTARSPTLSRTPMGGIFLAAAARERLETREVPPVAPRGMLEARSVCAEVRSVCAEEWCACRSLSQE